MEKEKKNPYLRAVPEVKSKSPGVRDTAPRAAVPKGGSEKPEGKSIEAKAAMPKGGSEKPEGRSIEAKAAVPKGGSEKPEGKSIEAKAAVPKGGSEKPEGKSIEAKAAVPNEAKYSIVHVSGWKGLNRRNTVDSGCLSEAKDICFDSYPYVESAYRTEHICDFKIDTVENGEVKTVGLGEVFNVDRRGDDFFIVGKNGYIFGRCEDDTVKYIAIADTQTEERMKKRKPLFVEKVNADSIADMKIERFAALYGDKEYMGNNAENRTHMPFMPVGNIRFVENFKDNIFGTEDCDTAVIYAVVPEGENKADEIWVYTENSTQGNAVNKKMWNELRRQIAIAEDGGVRYKPGSSTGQVWQSGFIYGYVGSEGIEVMSFNCKSMTMEAIDNLLVTYADETEKSGYKRVFRTADDIYSKIYEQYASDDTVTFRLKKGIFLFEQSSAPLFENVTWYKGRVFGSTGSHIVASEYNEYNRWDLDTAQNISASHAWMVTSSANTRTVGDVEALGVYMDNVIVLKRGYMQEITGGSNPFSIQDVYAIGVGSGRALAEAYGKLIMAADTNLYYYSGGLPRVFGRETGVNEYKDVVSGGRDEKYYLYCKDEKGEKHLFVYNFVYGAWSEKALPDDKEYVCIGGAGRLVIGITKDGAIFSIEGNERSGAWEFVTEDMTEGALDLKRLQKIKLYYEIGAASEVKVDTLLSEKRSAARCYIYKNTTGAVQRRRGEITLTGAVDYNLKLKFTGSGYFKLMGMEFEIKDGGRTTNDG